MRGLAGLLGILGALWAVAPAAALDFFEKTDLQFGGIAATSSQGPVIVTPQGSASCGVHTCLGGHQAARMHVKHAESSAQYSLSYSTGDVLTRVGGGGSIPLQNLNDSAGGLITTNGGGNAKFTVGGELLLGPDTPGGDYTGTYTIILELQ